MINNEFARMKIKMIEREGTDERRGFESFQRSSAVIVKEGIPDEKSHLMETDWTKCISLKTWGLV